MLHVEWVTQSQKTLHAVQFLTNQLDWQAAGESAEDVLGRLHSRQRNTSFAGTLTFHWWPQSSW
jgi:hypothetical protein